jgi:dihydrofolate synthase/folylpolyglutamate synthase
MNLTDFLASKPLFYDKIDYDRFPAIYTKYSSLFKLPKIVHIVGTNAKGSTGRALAHMLLKKGVKVGHYSSPHILKFNERIWLNGSDVDDNMLEDTHKFLQNKLKKEDIKSLSYFEYTTLLAMKIFCMHCEIVILEAGLGGEFDATNVFKKTLSILTPIGYDHEIFLGNSIEEIATTKLNSVKNDLILAKQNEELIYKLALKQVDKYQKNLYLAQSFLSDKIYKDLKDFITKNSYPNFFYDNFSSSLCALQILGYKADVSLLDGLKLFGRAYKIEKNITLDVGHNPLAASALKEYFIGKKVILVYNSFKDKDYNKVLKILKPIVKEVQIIDLKDSRVVSKEELICSLKKLNISYKNFKEIRDSEEYLVFGSFFVVERFLKSVSKK